MMRLIFLLLFISGCSLLKEEPAQKLNPAVYYKNDMCFWHLGKKFCGVGVIEEKEEMFLTMETHSDIEKFILTNCHREIDLNDPDKGLRRKNGFVTMQVTPTLEKGRACPYYFASFNRVGKHSWGIVAIKNQSYQLKAKVYCNGQLSDSEGVFMCQSREGLMQKLVFDEPVKLAKPVNGPAQRKENCPELKLSKDEKVLEYITPNRECLYGIIGKKSLKAYQLYTIGYEELILR